MDIILDTKVLWKSKNKKHIPKFTFLNEKNEKDSHKYDIQNWLWKSEIGIFWLWKSAIFLLNQATIWCGSS